MSNHNPHTGPLPDGDAASRLSHTHTPVPPKGHNFTPATPPTLEQYRAARRHEADNAL